jgi:signal transduction histidine kinase/PAS domain-containing protein
MTMGTQPEPAPADPIRVAPLPDLDFFETPVLEIAGEPPRLIQANGRAVALFGGEVPGMADGWAARLFGADGDRLLDVLRDVQRDGAARTSEVLVRVEGGRPRPLSVLVQVGRRHEGRPVSWLALMMEVGGPEDAARSRADMALVLRTIPVGVTVLDAGGSLIYANRAAAAVCGFSSGAEMMAVPIDEIARRLAVRDEDGHPIELAEHPSQVALSGREHERVLRLRPVGGPWSTSDRLVSVRSVPVAGPDGRVFRVVNVYRDITEFRAADRWQRFLGEASAALASSMDEELLLHVVADLAARSVADWCGIDLCRADGSVRRVAAARATAARPAAELEAAAPPPRAPLLAGGRPLLTPPPAEAGGPSVISVPLSTRGEVIGALTLVAAGGRPPYAQADLSAAEDLGRRVSITIDNVRLYAETQESLRAREDLLAIVSHDLRNPLGVVLASSALLLKSSLPPHKEERARRQVEAIQRAGNRMNRLIRDLLDFASIQGGRLTISRRPHDAAEMVGEVLDSLEPLAAQKSLHIENHVVGRHLSVMSDHDRMVQAFANIVGNAIKFTPEGGTIRVGAERDGEHVRFSIADTGPGISPEEVGHVFDRYFQARRKNREGIGLGLSIAKGIVDAHGGRIWVESEEGKGSTFFVALPV